ncbi:MAG TPA: hypothetical protein VGD77_02480 [Gemmatimonadaceae bacterium]
MRLSTEGARRRALLALCAAAAVAGCGSEGTLEPGGPSIAGAWTARVPAGSPSDSLLLVLADSGTAVTGVGYLSSMRPSVLGGEGTLVEDHLMLALGNGTEPGAQARVELSLQRADDRFEGTATVLGTAYPIQLRRAALGSGPAAGNWVLATVREPSPAAAIPFDTLRLDAIGSAHRGFANASCGYSVPGAVGESGGWIRVEYFSASGYGPPCNPPMRDSLQLVGDTLVRRTALVGGATREELYRRR